MKSVIIIAIAFVLLIPQVFAESVSNDVGSITIDESVIEIAQDTEYSLKIYGIIVPSQYYNKGHILITLPDGTTDGKLFIPTNDGYFESFFDINYDSQLGDYKILGTYGNQIIGSLSFSVSEKQFTVEEIKETRDEISKKDTIAEAEELAAAQQAEELAAAQQAEELAAAQTISQIESIDASRQLSVKPLHEQILEGITAIFLTLLVLGFLFVYFVSKTGLFKLSSKGFKLFGIQLFSPYSFDGTRRGFNQATKDAALRRQNYQCNGCGITPQNWDFDHIESRADNSIGNCQALCLDCHRNKTRYENRR